MGLTNPQVARISGSNSTFTGTVRVTGGPNITVGTDASGLSISGAAQTDQTQNRFNLTISGNTNGIASLVSSGVLTLFGGNNITLGQAGGNAVTISAGNQTFQTQDVLNVGVSTGGNTGGNTSVTTGSRLVFAGINNITAFQATAAGATTISFSGPTLPPAQSVQTQDRFDLTISGNTAGAGALVSSGTLTLVGGNNITLSQNANSITISGPNTVAQTAQTGISSIGASNTTYTSGGVTFTGSNMVTVKSGTGQAVVIDATQSAQTQNVHNITLTGNTAGVMAQVSSGTVSLAGGNNITLSQAGNAITISGANVGGAQTGISGVVASNATYTSGTITITGVGGGVTVSSNTGQRVDISVAAPVAQTVQTQNLHNVTLSGNTAGVMAQVSSGTLTLAGGNNITVSQNGNAVTISGANVGGAQTGISSIAASNTTYTSGAVTFTGSNIITVKSGTGQAVVIDATVAAQTVQTQNLFDLTISGNTAGAGALVSSGTLSLAGGNNVTLSQAGNAVTISGPNQSVQTQDVLSIGVSTGGNTAGNTTVNTGSRMVLVGAGAASLNQATAAGATTLSISVPVQSAQTGISGLAASNTTYTSGTVTISGVANITVSSNTGQRIDLSVAAQTVQTQNLHNVTISGNTSGALAAISSGTMTIAGGNNITISQAGNAITISGPNVGGAQTGISSIAASNTTYTSGGITFTGSNIVTVRSTTGQGIVIDATTAAQTVQTQNLHNVTLSGNTAGVMAQISSGTMTLAGGNNITVSQAGNAVTISGPNLPAAQTGISGVAASNTTYTSGTLTITGVGGGVTVNSNTGQRIDISVAAPVAQTVQTQNVVDVTLTGNTSGALALVSSGTLSLAGGNNITLSQAGNAITISGANVGGAQTGISSIAASNTTYTSGAVTFTGSNAVTVRSTTGQAVVIDAPVQTAQTQNLHNVTLSGNTSGAMAQVSSGTLTLAGGSNITLSQAGNAVTIIGASGGGTGGGFSAGVSTGGNTSGSTGLSGSNLVLAGINNITLSQATDTAGATISISAPNTTNQTVQTQNLFNLTLSSNTAGAMAQVSSGTLTLAGGNNITLSQAGNAVTISGANVPAATNLSIGASTGGNTLGNTTVNTGSRFVVVGSGMVTASQGTAAGATTMTINATQSVQTQDVLSIGASTGGNTLGNTTVNTGSRFVIVGSGMVTASQGTAAGATTMTLNATQSVQTQNLHNVTVSGNTSGALAAISSGTMTLAGGNNITLSQAGNAVTISAGAGGGLASAGISTQGNTTGTTGFASQSIQFVGGNNITLSQSLAAGGATISIAAPGPNAAQFSIGASNLGDTAGSTGVTGTRFVFVGTGGLSLSQSTDATGATLSMNAGANTLHNFVMNHQAGLAISNIINLTATQVTQRPMFVPFDLDDFVLWKDMYIEVSRAATGVNAFTINTGIYSYVNSTSLALIGSGQNVFSHTETGSNSGFRHVRIQGAGAAVTSLIPQPYVMGVAVSATATSAMNYLIRGWSSAAIAGVLASGTDQRSTAASQLSSIPLGPRFGGLYTATSNVMPANVGITDVSMFTSYVPYWFRLVNT